MQISVLLAHPRPGSFNHALAETVAETLRADGHQVRFHDLYQEMFDPLLPARELGRSAELPPDVACHCEEIAHADGIVIVHPNWWGMPPAILTGWVDRVLRPGVAYAFESGDSGEGVPRGLLRARAALVLNTSDTEPQREREVFADPLDTIWKNCIFGLCGVTRVERRMLAVMVTSTTEQRRVWLEEVRSLAQTLFSGRP